MQAEVKNKYLSISEGTKFLCEFPDFTVITGENGAGKTHFIDSICNAATHILENGTAINTNPSLLVKEDYITLQSKVSFNKDVNGINYFINSMVSIKNGDNRTGYQTINMGGIQYTYSSLFTEIENSCKSRDLNGQIEFKDEDIESWAFKNYYKMSPFECVNICNMIYAYYMKTIENLAKEREGIPFLTEEDFTIKFKDKPWEILNKILFEKTKLNFKFNFPT